MIKQFLPLIWLDYSLWFFTFKTKYPNRNYLNPIDIFVEKKNKHDKQIFTDINNVQQHAPEGINP